MFFRTIAAAFFVARSASANSLSELAGRAGVTSTRPLSDTERRALGRGEAGREVLYGTWGAFGACWCIVDALERHECLQIYTSMNAYLDALPSSGEDGMQQAIEPFVATFRDACLALDPEVAFLDTRAHYGDEEWDNKLGSRTWILSQYPTVLGREVNTLADERFPLLYIDDDLKQRWVSDESRDDRDMVEVARGFMVFARSGPYRLA